MKRPDGWIVASGILIAIAALLVTLTFSNRAYLIERTISILLDREIHIEEVVDLELGSLISATLRGVRMDHSEFRFQAEFLLVEMNFSEWLSREEINLTRLLVSNAELQLKPTGSEPAATGRPLIPKAFAFKNLTLSYIDEDQDWQAHIVSCTGMNRSNTSIADLNCRGELNKAPFTVAGHYGLPDEAGTVESLDIAVNWSDLSLTAKGKLDSLLDLTGANLDLTIDSPNSRPLFYLLGINEIRNGNINVKARIEDRLGNDTYEFNMDGAIAGFAVRMDGTTQFNKQFGSTDANFLFSGPSLYEAGAIFNELRLAPQPFLASGHFSFNDNALDISELNLQIAQGTLKASVMIPKLPNTTGMHLKIEGKQFKPNFLKAVAEACDLPNEPLDIIAEVTLEDSGQLVFVDARSATFQLNAMGNINRSPGDVDVKTTVRGATMATLGQCFGIKLPGIPVRAAAVITRKGDQITLDKLRMDSDVIGVAGLVNVVLEPELAFDTTLEITVPNARKLAAGLMESPGPVREFPFESSLSAHGSGTSLVLKSLEINAGNNTGRASGVLIETSTLHGLNLELALSGDDLHYLLENPRRRVWQALPYSLNTRIENQLGTWVIDRLHATLAKTTLDLSARITDKPEYVGSTLQIKADGKNVENLFGPWVAHPLPSLPYAISTEMDVTEDYLRFENLSVTIGEHEASGAMFLDKPPNFSKTSGQLSLKGPSTNELAELLGVEHAFLERDYLATFQIEGTQEALILNNLNVTVGESDLAGQVTFLNTRPPTLELDLRSEALYLPLFSPGLLAEKETKEKPKEASSVFSSTDLSSDWLALAEGKLKYRVERMWASTDYTTSVDTEMALVAGELNATRFQWEGEHSKGALDLTLSRTDDQFNLKMNTQSSRLPLVWLFAGEALPSEGTSFSAVFDSRGNSVKSMMGNLNGAIVFKGGPGKVEAGKLENLFGDFFLALSRKIAGENSDSRTNVVCTAGGIQIENGMSRLEPGLVAQTDQISLYASGVVDLKSEQPNLALMTKPRTGIGISAAKVIAPRLKVKGTLANPSFSVDSTSSAISTYAAVISGGVSVLATGLWDRVTRSPAPCDDMYELALKEIKIPVRQ